MDKRVVFICSLAGFVSATVKLQPVYSWNILDWNYPDSYTKQQALDCGALIPENALPVGIERWKNKLFITIPRWRAGIPATLNYIFLDASYELSPKMNAYPSFEANELGNCQCGLSTVYRSKADKCDRLWVLDSGTFGNDADTIILCPNTLNVYDLNTDKLIRRYVFRPEDTVPTSLIANMILDESANCEDVFAYFTDELGYGLVVYSWQQNRSWRFEHGYLMPDPLAGDFNTAGVNYQWYTSGAFGIAISPIGSNGYRTVYFTSLASYSEFAVSTCILRNEKKVGSSYHDFYVVGHRSNNSHISVQVMDDTGIQLFGLIDQNAIGCWHSAVPYKSENIEIIDKDDIGLIYPTDVKIDYEGNVWVLSDRMPIFLNFGFDYSDINFRIYKAPLKDLIKGTVCEPKPFFGTYA